MSARQRMRALARRAIGTPDATEVERALGELRQAVDDLRQTMDRVELLATDDTRQQVDRLQAAVLEHADTLDRIVGHTTGRPVT